MDPDSPDEMDATTFEDILTRDSLDDDRHSDSSCSSISNTYEELPVYRSLDVMHDDFTRLQSLSGIDKVFEAPTLSRQPRVTAKQPTSIVDPVDTLFDQLNTDMMHSFVPCHSDVLGGVSKSTSVVVLANGLDEVSHSVLQCLRANGVHFDHFEASGLWKCELTDFVDSCRFHIQVYIGDDDKVDGMLKEHNEYTVEFLRMSGCTRLFSEQFRRFKSSQHQSGEVKENLVGAEMRLERNGLENSVSLNVEVSQAALEALTGWAIVDRESAVAAVVGICSDQSFSSTLLCSDQLSTEGVMVMTLLGTLCMQFKESEDAVGSTPGLGVATGTSGLPMLSLLHLLLQIRGRNELHASTQKILTAMINSLVPATARLTANSQVSTCIRETAVHMMEINCH